MLFYFLALIFVFVFIIVLNNLYRIGKYPGVSSKVKKEIQSKIALDGFVITYADSFESASNSSETWIKSLTDDSDNGKRHLCITQDGISIERTTSSGRRVIYGYGFEKSGDEPIKKYKSSTSIMKVPVKYMLCLYGFEFAEQIISQKFGFSYKFAGLKKEKDTKIVYARYDYSVKK